MKLEEALKIMGRGNEKVELCENGFMVDFEIHDKPFLRSCHFPDKHGGELLISDKQKAWELAEIFSATTGSDIVNIYVVDSSFNPVSERTIKPYPEISNEEKGENGVATLNHIKDSLESTRDSIDKVVEMYMDLNKLYENVMGNAKAREVSGLHVPNFHPFIQELRLEREVLETLAFHVGCRIEDNKKDDEKRKSDK